MNRIYRHGRLYQVFVFFIFVLFIFSNPTSLCAKECVGDFTLTTQREIGNFDCTSVTGSLTIDEAVSGNITNLDGLFELTSVGGQLRIVDNAALTNIDGLAALTSVGGWLFCRGQCRADQHRWVSGPDIGRGGGSHIADNAALTNLDGLAVLTSVGKLFIYGNAALTNIDGLAVLTSVGYLQIWGNAALTNIDGLAALTSVGGWVQITKNAALTNIDGLAVLTSVGGRTTSLTMARCYGVAAFIHCLLSEI